jgi:hypothetical protein
VFAGELNYSRYEPLDKWIIRLIMWITNGPTDFSTKVVFTDWDEVGRFAEQVAGQVAALAAGRGQVQLLFDDQSLTNGGAAV